MPRAALLIHGSLFTKSRNQQRGAQRYCALPSGTMPYIAVPSGAVLCPDHSPLAERTEVSAALRCITVPSPAVPCNTKQSFALPCHPVICRALRCPDHGSLFTESRSQRCGALPCTPVQYFTLRCNTSRRTAVPCRADPRLFVYRGSKSALRCAAMPSRARRCPALLYTTELSITLLTHDSLFTKSRSQRRATLPCGTFQYLTLRYLVIQCIPTPCHDHSPSGGRAEVGALPYVPAHCAAVICIAVLHSALRCNDHNLLTEKVEVGALRTATRRNATITVLPLGGLKSVRSDPIHRSTLLSRAAPSRAQRCAALLTHDSLSTESRSQQYCTLLHRTIRCRALPCRTAHCCPVRYVAVPRSQSFFRGGLKSVHYIPVRCRTFQSAAVLCATLLTHGSLLRAEVSVAVHCEASRSFTTPYRPLCCNATTTALPMGGLKSERYHPIRCIPLRCDPIRCNPMPRPQSFFQGGLKSVHYLTARRIPLFCAAVPYAALQC